MNPIIFSILIPTFLTFLVAMAATPFVTDFLYNNRLWKKKKRYDDNQVAISEAFKAVADKKETGTPRIGGILVWGSVAVMVLLGWLLQYASVDGTLFVLDFTSRAQTLIPITVFICTALIGLADDICHLFPGFVTFELSQGVPGKFMAIIMLIIGTFGGWWFFAKLGVSTLLVPFVGVISVGWLIIPFFIIVLLGTFSSGIIDGVDGLAPGVMAIVYGAYGVISYSQSMYDLSALCFAIVGALMAFLWFNIPPARFYLGETGMLPLVTTLAFIAFLSGQVLLLLIIGLPLVVTALSSFIQIISKKYWGYKVFKVAPLHHHFEVLGWSREKITMRYWVISVMCAVVGVIIALI